MKERVVNVALCEARHEMPEGVTGSIYPNTIDPVDVSGITATAGIGTNLYLCKVAMDIVAKHIEPNSEGVRIARLNEIRASN